MPDHKCGLYVRVSTARQAAVDEGSLDTQTEKLRKYVQYEKETSTDKWEVVAIYREEGKSGKDTNRPQYQKMMADVASGRINTVICCKIDRITRSLRDFYSLWETMALHGVQFISLSEKFDTQTALGRALLKFILVFAELEREQTGERTASVMIHRAQQGLWNGGHILGYRLAPDDKGNIVIDPEYAPIVKKIFDLYLKFASADRVVKYLNERGYKMPRFESRRGRPHGGTPFNKQIVLRVLSNPVYLGKIKWKKVLHPGRHKPLITQAKFDAIQTLINKNRVNRRSVNRVTNHTFLLQGLLRCGKCGSLMTPTAGSGKGKAYYYYQCTKALHTSYTECKSKSVPAGTVEDFVINRLKQIALSDTEIDKLVKNANRNSSKELTRFEAEQAVVVNRLKEIKAAIAILMDVVLKNGAKGFKSVKTKLAALETEQTTLEEQAQALEFKIAGLETKRLSSGAMATEYRTLPKLLKQFQKKPLELKGLLRLFIQAIDWHVDPQDPKAGLVHIAYFEGSPIKTNRPLNPLVNGVSTDGEIGSAG